MVIRMIKRSRELSISIKTLACLLIIIVPYMAMFPVNVLGQQEPIYGRIVDEDGDELSEVKVEVYSSESVLLTIEYSDSDGDFSVYLQVNSTYTLHFSKSGYTDSMKSVYLGDEDVDLGDIVLQNTLRMSSRVLSLVANPGDKLVLPFTLSNIGEEEEKVTFRISEPEGWSTRILDQITEVTKVSLSSGSSLDLQLEVMIPMESESATLSLTADGTHSEDKLKFTITVESSSEPILSCQIPGKATSPGESIRFRVNVKNTFGVDMLFRVTADSFPDDWTVSVESVDGEDVTELALDSGESVDLIIKVTTPSNASLREYEIIIKAESSNVTAFLPLSITLTEAEEKEEIEIAASFREVTVEAGKVVNFPITIINSGEDDKILFLSIVESPEDWKVAFMSGTIEVSGLYLASSESENLIVEVTPPSTVNIGSYIITVQVESEEGVIYTRLELVTIISGSYNLRLTTSTLLTSATVGGSTTFTATLSNTGQTSITGLRLSVDVPDEWEASVSPTQVESLKSRESYTFTVVVDTPADAVAGDYLLTVKGLSDQIESDEVQVRVETTASTSWGLVGIGIAAIAIVALIIVFKKFRRR